MEQNKSTIRGIAENYRSAYRKLYYIACAVAGNDRAAERALVNVMLTADAEEAEQAVVRAARQAQKELGGEITFDCLPGEEESGLLGDRIACLSEEARRAAMLRYGVGLPAGDIADIMKMPVGKIKKYLGQVMAEAARSVRNGEAERALRALCAREMADNELAPDFNTLLRAAEKQLASVPAPRRRSHRLRKTANWFTAIVTLLIVAFLIWCGVVLMDYFRQSNESVQRVGWTNVISEETNARV